ncbi:MAG: DPP IV N-terminal domain-containing protein [Gammaproteobacteria bacterium]|nr:DPP IV N-terminal domain-containing protein [Gammaproteobacteria bacterium]
MCNSTQHLIGYAINYGPEGPNDLWKIDFTSHRAHLIKSGFPYAEDAGLAINSKGELYGLSESYQLVSINKRTGDHSVVGDIDVRGNGHGADFIGDVMVGAIATYNDNIAKFFTLNTATAARTDFMDLPGFTVVGSMAIVDPTTIYFHAVADSSTSAALYVVDVPTTSVTKISDTSSRFRVMDFGIDGNLYGLGVSTSPGLNGVYRLDPFSGTETLLFDLPEIGSSGGWQALAMDKGTTKRSLLCCLLSCFRRS